LLIAVSGDDGETYIADVSMVSWRVFGVTVSLSLIVVSGVDGAAWPRDVTARGVLGATARSSLITVSTISGEDIVVNFLIDVEGILRVENARSLASRFGDVAGCFALSS
jgi:hypothetical protein